MIIMPECSTLLEVFCAAESTHGVCYMRMVGDSDSLVYTTLLLSIPVRGRVIQKIECTNHACKCWIGVISPGQLSLQKCSR